jgi:hypothetical protein
MILCRNGRPKTLWKEHFLEKKIIFWQILVIKFSTNFLVLLVNHKVHQQVFQSTKNLLLFIKKSEPIERRWFILYVVRKIKRKRVLLDKTTASIKKNKIYLTPGAFQAKFTAPCKVIIRLIIGSNWNYFKTRLRSSKLKLSFFQAFYLKIKVIN